MKISRRLIAIMLMLLLVSCMFPITVSAGGSRPVKAIVVFDPAAVSGPQGDAMIRSEGGTTDEALTIINGAAVTLPSEAAGADLAVKPGVKFVQLDHEVHLLSDGQNFVAAVTQHGQVIPWGISRVKAPQAWAKTTGLGVKVAVLDTGIQLNHPDLAANIKGGVNIVNPGRTANDDNGHGTHVAGIIAAANNPIGVVGVAPRVSLYAVKVLNAAGGGYDSNIISGLQWAANNRMKVVNMSFGSAYDDPALHAAIASAYKSGVTLVAASGNGSGPPVNYPGAYPEVIAVSATTGSNTLASYSSTGPAVDIAAPGQSIYSTYPGSGYATLSGTSMAAPHVSGAAALVIASGKASTPAGVKSRLQATAIKLGLTAYKQGAGLVNAYAAVTAP